MWLRAIYFYSNFRGSFFTVHTVGIYNIRAFQLFRETITLSATDRTFIKEELLPGMQSGGALTFSSRAIDSRYIYQEMH